MNLRLLDDLSNDAGTNRAATFADSKAQALLQSDGGNQGDFHVDVVTGHDHLRAVGQLDAAGHVGGTEVELRTIAVEERGMTAAFFLRQDVNLTDEVRVRMNRTGLGQNLTTLDLVALC